MEDYSALKERSVPCISASAPTIESVIKLENTGLTYFYISLNRIISNTLKVGAVGSVAVTAVYGLDAGLPYSLGATSGALYLFLLGKRTDLIGAGESEVERRLHRVPHSMPPYTPDKMTHSSN